MIGIYVAFPSSLFYYIIYLFYYRKNKDHDYSILKKIKLHLKSN